MVLLTFFTMSGCGRGHVPIDSALIVLGLMKLWVAPQSRSALILVILCHMFTVKEIVIESF